MKALLGFIVLTLLTVKSHATIIEAEFNFDGARFVQESGDDIFVLDFAVGDTLKLTFSVAELGAYWNLGNIRTSYGFDLGFTESAYRGVDGSYNFSYEGTTVLSTGYYYITSCCEHAGPEAVWFRGEKWFDSLTIDYRLIDSNAAINSLTGIDDNAGYSIWNTLSSSENFVNPNAVNVSAPSTVIIIVVGILGLAIRRVLKQRNHLLNVE